jgi:NAD(P)-dependent dehydrogenase (short-subunit alcohol dehydrogenase family)
VIGRIGKPADIARAILFLADDTASGFMTGQSLIVDGGATIKLSTE